MKTSKLIMESLSRIEENATHYSWFSNPGVGETSDYSDDKDCCIEPKPVRPTSDPAPVDKETVENMIKPLDIEGELTADGMDPGLCNILLKSWDSINTDC